MESTELRIGNLVYLKGVKMLYKVSTSSLYQGIAMDCDSIPLTEEIIFKFGLALHKDKVGIKYFKKGHLYFLWVTDHLVVSYLDSDGTYVDIQAQRIYHVHQLQNLYYALTGEELTVNL